VRLRVRIDGVMREVDDLPEDVIAMLAMFNVRDPKLREGIVRHWADPKGKNR
jgi:hypothetical protein